MKKYNKLVRDKIPKIIKNSGGECKFHSAKKNEFINLLTNKLLEEVNEFIENPCAEEIADILNVIETLGKVHKITLNEIKEAKRNKLKEHGGFFKMIVLDEATEENR